MPLSNIDLQEYITKKALHNGAILVGYTRIRRVQPVILFGFPYSDKWFLNYPITLTKKLGKVYTTSRHVQDLIAKTLKFEGYTAHYKTILSLYGDFRPLVVAAGLGEWGRNGLVVNKKYGSGVLYAALFTNAPLETVNHIQQKENQQHCTSCGECVKACPASAFQDNTFHLYRCAPFALTGCAECLKTCRGNKESD